MGISVMGEMQQRKNEMQCSGNDKDGVMIYIEKNRIRFHYDAEELWIELPGDGTLWKESETEKEYSGGQWICVPVTLESMPVFIKK